MIFQDLSSKYNVIGEKVFSSDGHPSFSADGRWMVTDTYPDRTRCAYLVLYDVVTDCHYNLAYLRSPRRFATTQPTRHIACDLHPRIDRIGRYLCFDATYTGQRSLCIIDLGEAGLNQQPKALAL